MVNKIKTKLSIVDYSKETQKVVDYFKIRIGGSSGLVKLDNILNSSKFSGQSGLFAKLQALSPTTLRSKNYASLEAFKDRFLEMHSASNNIKVLDDVLKDFEHFVNNHANAPGAAEYIDELLQSSNKFKGGAFGLEIPANPPPAIQANPTLKFLEKGIDDGADGGFRFDMFFESGLNKLWVETKNYASGTAFSQSFYNQFKAYVSNKQLTKISELKYYFKANDGVTKESQVKRFKSMLLSGDRYKEVYNLMSSELKNELGVSGFGGEQKFYNLVYANSEIFYKFIEIY